MGSIPAFILNLQKKKSTRPKNDPPKSASLLTEDLPLYSTNLFFTKCCLICQNRLVKPSKQMSRLEPEVQGNCSSNLPHLCCSIKIST